MMKASADPLRLNTARLNADAEFQQEKDTEEVTILNGFREKHFRLNAE